MPCLFRYRWLKLPRAALPQGKGLSAYWARLAARAAFRKGVASYYGTAAEEDLRGIKQEYTRKKILFAAAAIGDDKPSIERIYGDSYLDITDLNQLPVKLTTLVKRHIRV